VTGRDAPSRGVRGRASGHALLVATFNPGKAREVAALLARIGIAAAGLRERGITEAYEERSATYEENALGKARHYAALAGMIAVADDSGLEVDALGGAPGPLSARYGGPGLDDAGRCRLLLETLREVPDGARGARYVAVVAIARPDGKARAFRGVCEGRIGREARGAGGFGYDPLFHHPPSAATFAELPEQEKGRVSHRGQAVARLLEFLLSAEGKRFLAAGR
jgi:XTP/dITP diphosphohydrolase